jgi:HrpA-like RNA helicase
MSATLDIKLIGNYYGESYVLEVAGRTYPIEDEFSSTDDNDYLNQAILKACEIHQSNQPGDILAFLTGPDEIDQAITEVQQRLKDAVIVLPLHGKLHPDETKRIFERTPGDKRKIIFSTNVAETSVTIDGVRHVIESGMVKEMMWDETLKMQALKIGRITQSSAKQRRGRAGRTSPGKVSLSSKINCLTFTATLVPLFVHGNDLQSNVGMSSCGNSLNGAKYRCS